MAQILEGRCDRSHGAYVVTRSYSSRMAQTRHGLASTERRDPIGYAVAALNKLAQSDVLDRVGLRKQTEKAVYSATHSGFKAITATGRAFAKAGKRGEPGTHPAPARTTGVFDLTPTEDEQMLVDVVTELAD